MTGNLNAYIQQKCKIFKQLKIADTKEKVEKLKAILSTKTSDIQIDRVCREIILERTTISKEYQKIVDSQ